MKDAQAVVTTVSGGPSTAAGRSRTSGTGSEPTGRPYDEGTLTDLPPAGLPAADLPTPSLPTQPPAQPGSVPRAPLRPLAQDWAWQERAACRGADPRLFFPKDDERGTARRVRQQAAAAFCGQCDVRRACLEHALRTGERYGVWGGYEQGRLREMLGEGAGRATA